MTRRRRWANWAVRSRASRRSAICLAIRSSVTTRKLSPAFGTAEVRELFKVPKIGTVAGCIVRSGTITRNSKARLIRDSVVISDNLSVDSLRRFKDDATEVREGFECGIGIGYNDIRLEDVIETFEMREKPRA